MFCQSVLVEIYGRTDVSTDTSLSDATLFWVERVFSAQLLERSKSHKETTTEAHTIEIAITFLFGIDIHSVYHALEPISK